jgi:hypothetical protein
MNAYGMCAGGVPTFAFEDHVDLHSSQSADFISNSIN